MSGASPVGATVWESIDDLLECVESPLSAADVAHRMLAAEVRRLYADNDRLRRERYDLLGVTTAEGLGAAEWMCRTADAEGRRKRADAKVERISALPAKWRADLAKFQAAPYPTWHVDAAALIERATAAFCEELEAALRSEP